MTNCGKEFARTENYIIGGQRTDIEYVPWQVSIISILVCHIKKNTFISNLNIFNLYI